MTFSNEVIAIINDLCTKFGIAIDWTAENVVPYIQDLGSRFVAYTMTMAIVSLSIKFIFLFIGLYIIYKSIKWGKEDDESVCPIMLGIFGFGMTFFSLISLICVGSTNIQTIIACIYIPESIIIEYIKTLL